MTLSCSADNKMRGLIFFEYQLGRIHTVFEKMINAAFLREFGGAQYKRRFSEGKLVNIVI
jgi:hypothetical protein